MPDQELAGGIDANGAWLERRDELSGLLATAFAHARSQLTFAQVGALQ